MKDIAVSVLLIVLALLTFWQPVRNFLNQYLARLDVATSLVGEQRGYLYYWLLLGSLFLSFWILKPKLKFLKPYVPMLIVLTFMLLLTQLQYRDLRVPLSFLFTLFGTVGLFFIYCSARYLNPNPVNAWKQLLIGATVLFVSYWLLRSLAL